MSQCQNTSPTPIPPTLSIQFKDLSIVAEKTNPSNPTENAIEVAYLEKEHGPINLELTVAGRKSWVFPKPKQPLRKIHVIIQKVVSKDQSRFKSGNPSDPEDISWMPDFSRWHHPVTTQLKPTCRLHMSAKVSVRDAIFFTAERSHVDAVVTNLDTDEYKVLENVGTVLGSSISCSSGESIRISVNAIDQISGHRKEIDSYLISDINVPHELEIKYKLKNKEDCDHDPLHLLYDYFVKTSDGSRFRFEYIDRPTPSDQFACQTYGGGGYPLPDFP